MTGLDTREDAGPPRRLRELVDTFAFNVIAQDEASNADEGNTHARAQLKAFDALVAEFGDDGREALCPLLDHRDPRVRCMAAAFLLRYQHGDAMRVLEELARGRGVVALAAQCSIKNWHSGDWELDPAPAK